MKIKIPNAYIQTFKTTNMTNNKDLILLNIRTGYEAKNGTRLKIKAEGMNPVTGIVENVTTNGFIMSINKNDKWYTKWELAINKKVVTLSGDIFVINDCKKMVKQ